MGGGRDSGVPSGQGGVYGNTHFLFSDMNNVAVADLLSQWLKAKRLD